MILLDIFHGKVGLWQKTSWSYLVFYFFLVIPVGCWHTTHHTATTENSALKGISSKVLIDFNFTLFAESISS